MKELTQKTELVIRNAIDIATTLGIETMVIDSFSLRGQNIDNGVIMIKSMKDHKLEFDSMGLGRLNALKNRLNLFGKPSIKYDVVDEDASQSVVAKLKIAEGRSSVTYKCQAPNLIKAAKAINDVDYCKLVFKDEDVKTLLKGVGVIENISVNITIDDETVKITVSEKEGDSFTHELLVSATYLSDKTDIISKSFKSQVLKIILSNYIKKDESAEVLTATITQRGIMRFEILDLNIYLFPER